MSPGHPGKTRAFSKNQSFPAASAPHFDATLVTTETRLTHRDDGEHTKEKTNGWQIPLYSIGDRGCKIGRSGHAVGPWGTPRGIHCSAQRRRDRTQRRLIRILFRKNKGRAGGIRCGLSHVLEISGVAAQALFENIKRHARFILGTTDHKRGFHACDIVGLEKILGQEALKRR